VASPVAKGILGRDAWAGDEGAGARVDGHVVKQELGVPFQQGVGYGTQELAVLRVLVVGPELRGYPRACRGMQAPGDAAAGSCITPDVGRSVSRPTFAPIDDLSGARTRLYEVGYPAEEGCVALGEVGDVGSPVVLLGVDVEVVVVGPSHVAREVVVEESLQGDG
jgi:hypothetical protein